jgi:hypothetical protein
MEKYFGQCPFAQHSLNYSEGIVDKDRSCNTDRGCPDMVDITM